MSSTALLERNLVVYGRYRIASHLLFWLPTSVLFLSARTDLGTALWLWAAYFLSVVAAEVPSGWFSDRVSRVATLRLGAVAWIVAACLLLAAGSSVPVLMAGQVFLALGFAFRSGTDQALHYDTLEALDRAEEFERREARAGRNAFVGTMAAALAGGLLGVVDLRLPYLAWLAAAIAQLVATRRLTEPPRHVDDPPITLSSSQLRSALGSLRDPTLAWIFVFMVVQQPLEGLALDLMQPWLTLVTGTTFDEPGTAPLVSGGLMAVVSIVGAAAVAVSPRLRAAIGTRSTLVLLSAVEAAILIGMATVVSPWLLVLLALRSTQTAAAPVVVATATAPRLARSVRATFLSLGSLGGRLANGVTLVWLGRLDDIDDVLDAGAAIGVVCLVVLIASGALLRATD
ncbi:MAG: MFS transporter, partial [Actinomycetota bacterium]|nr:MFS transporter [Actinomycetota bacterium]